MEVNLTSIDLEEDPTTVGGVGRWTCGISS